MTPDLNIPLHLAQGMGFSLVNLYMILFVIVSVIMILIVLIQRPQGGGLSGAFGAAADGAGQTAFGAKTGDALTLATVTTFVIFLGAGIALNFTLRPSEITLEEASAQSTGIEEDSGEGDDGFELMLGGEDAGSGTITPQRLEMDENGNPILPRPRGNLTPPPATEPAEKPVDTPPADTPPSTDDPSDG